MDANAVATGAHNYGKTPVFFALARCRHDAATLLLARGARARVLNNKGQSVLSLAASHCARATVDAVVAAEAAEEAADAERADGACAGGAREAAGGWLNFRASHSDGLFYGDLDPRFAHLEPFRPPPPGGDALSECGRACLLYTSPSPRDGLLSRMPSSA